jgi:ornithine--oxo-acid transaminase
VQKPNTMSPSAATTPSETGEAAVKARPASVHATSTDQAIQYEHEFAAHNYHPLPVVMARGEGVRVWDPEVSFATPQL